MPTTDQALAITAHSLRDTIKERIRASFVELIPEEQWAALVQSEIDDFLRVYRRESREERHKSDIQLLVREELTEQFKALVKAELAKPEYAHRWAMDGGTQPSDAVGAIIQQLIPDLVKGIFGAVVQDAVNVFRNRQW